MNDCINKNKHKIAYEHADESQALENAIERARVATLFSIHRRPTIDNTVDDSVNA